VTRTKDGVAITLSFSYQYRFDANDLKALYNQFTTNYQQPMIRVARNSMLQVAGNFTRYTTKASAAAIQPALFNSVLIRYMQHTVLAWAKDNNGRYEVSSNN
jgi:hypothetical protein